MARNSLEISMMDLNRLIGYPADTLIEISGDLSLMLDTIVTGIPDQVFQARPEVVSQQKMVEIKEINSEIVKAAYLPKVFVGVIPEYGAPNTNLGGTDPMYNTSILAGVNVPLVRWGQKSQDVRKEMSLAEADKFRLQELKDEISMELNMSDYQLQEAVKRVDLTRNSLVKAEENLTIMTDRYLESLTSILEVLDAQQYWQRSFKEMLDAEVNYKQTWILYRKAYGIL
jgi:outer membrane protein TolC